MSTSGQLRWRLLVCVLGAFVGARCSESPTAPTVNPPPPPPIDPPKISCPASVAMTSAVSLSVIYSPPLVLGGATPVVAACTPPSGSLFGVGTTAVTCTATDAQQRSDSCKFDVTVTAPPTLTKTSFVAFGDSITAGEDGFVPTGTRLSLAPTVILVGQEYPTVLRSLLAQRYSTQASMLTVDNRGNPGEAVTDSTTFPRFKNVLSAAPYQVLLLMEGSNDVGSQSVSLLQSGTIPGLRQMLQYAKGQGLRPYLATVPPMVTGGQRAGGAPLVPFYNSLVRALAAEQGVTLVDVAQQVFGGDGPLDTSQGLISADGLHPNAQGYAAMAATFFASIKATLEQSTGASLTTFKQPLLGQSSRPLRR